MGKIQGESEMRKCIAAVMAMILMVLMTAAASAATVFVSNEGGSLNLRQGPGKEHESVGFVQHGDVIEVIKKGGVWSEVRTEDGLTGYIKTLYIEGIDYIYASDTDYDGYGYMAFTNTSAAFRAGATMVSEVMDTFEPGVNLRILGKNRNFYLVETEDRQLGFVQEDHISYEFVDEARFVRGDEWQSPMYEDADSSSKVIENVPTLATVYVIKDGNYWSKVRYKDKVGWMRSSDLSD